MRHLIVLYDAQCILCCGIRNWLQEQPKYVDLYFVAAASERARFKYPELNHQETLKELTVVSDKGVFYQGAKAWVMCLWALKNYRGAALRLGTPELMPVAKRFIVWISNNRYRIGNLTKTARQPV
ncbi:MAG: DUF393 domain-containing protein [Blastocatellia bacterium]|nr:DUF393 domain-containing protein [Blastocatellia bacterium]